MLSSPLCNGRVGGLCHNNSPLSTRQPLRLQTRTLHANRQSQNQATSCGFRPRRNTSAVVCSSVENESDPVDELQSNLKHGLRTAAALSWAPFAIALPLCFGDNGIGGNQGGSGGGGGGGDGSGSGGHGHNSQNIIAELAADSSDEEDDEEEEEEEDEEEEDDEEVCVQQDHCCQTRLAW